MTPDEIISKWVGIGLFDDEPIVTQTEADIINGLRADIKQAIIAAVEEKTATLRAALEQVEWVSTAGCDHAMMECPWCGGFDWSGGHEPDCARQLALAARSTSNGETK